MVLTAGEAEIRDGLGGTGGGGHLDSEKSQFFIKPTCLFLIKHINESIFTLTPMRALFAHSVFNMKRRNLLSQMT